MQFTEGWPVLSGWNAALSRSMNRLQLSSKQTRPPTHVRPGQCAGMTTIAKTTRQLLHSPVNRHCCQSHSITTPKGRGQTSEHNELPAGCELPMNFSPGCGREGLPCSILPS